MTKRRKLKDDAQLRSLHKIYLQEDSNTAANAELISTFRAQDQGVIVAVAPAVLQPPARSDNGVDVPALRDAWSKMQDTHDFFSLLRRLDLRRTQALRLGGEDFARRLPASCVRVSFESAAHEKTVIMIFVGSSGCIQIHSGPISNV